MNNDIQANAELLARFFSFEYLKAKEELFEDFYEVFTAPGSVYDPIRTKECFELMTTYLIAMSLKELKISNVFEEKLIYTKADIAPEEYN